MRRASRVLLVLLTLLVGVMVHRALAHGEAAHAHRSLRGLPLSVGPWRGVEGSVPQDVLAALRVDDYVYRSYRGSNAGPIILYVAYYGRQHLDERIHSPSGCLPAGGWFPVSVGHQEIVVPGSTPSHFAVNRYLVTKGSDRQVVLYWFQGRGRAVANEVRAAFYLAFDTLTGRGSDETLVRVNALVRTSPAETLAEELRFLQAFYPRLVGFEAGR